MLTSYEFWYVKRFDNVHISECAVRFYEGEITTVDEDVADNGTKEPVTRYRISGKTNPRNIEHTKHRGHRKDDDGNDVAIYTPEDFGIIQDEEDLRLFMNNEMKKDKRGENIPEQR